MRMDYDKEYRQTKEVFGHAPEALLQKWESRISRDHPVLDIGAGQGRNTLYLARKGFRLDAIDPSTVAIDTIRDVANTERLSVRVYACGFDTFAPEVDSYSAILVFGLIQILPWESIHQLVRLIDRRLDPAGLVFATAFTTVDDSYARHAHDWTTVGCNSFQSPDGDVRTYLKPGELPTLFRDYDVLHHWEGQGPEHRHGDGPLQRHALVGVGGYVL